MPQVKFIINVIIHIEMKGASKVEIALLGVLYIIASNRKLSRELRRLTDQLDGLCRKEVLANYMSTKFKLERFWVGSGQYTEKM